MAISNRVQWGLNSNLLIVMVLLILGLSSRAGAWFTTPVPVNSNSKTTTRGNIWSSIDMAANGTAIAVWPGGGPNSLDPQGDDPFSQNGVNEDIFFSRSTNFGVTWGAMAQLKTSADRADDVEPDIATDGNGRWVVAWRTKGALGGNLGIDTDILFSYSSDDGLTWSDPWWLNTDAATDVYKGDFSPQIATDRQGNWIVSWSVQQSNGVNWTEQILASRSTDNGAHWSSPFVAFSRNVSTLTGFTMSDLATDRANHWILSWTQKAVGASDLDIFCISSSNNGASWSSVCMVNTNGNTDSGDDYISRIDTDGAGLWIATWTSLDSLGGTIGTDADILYACSIDNGLTWSAPKPMNQGAESDGTMGEAYVRIISGRDGTWVAAWLTRQWGGDLDIAYARSIDNGANWSHTLPANSNALTDTANDGGGPGALAMASDGAGHWGATWDGHDPQEGPAGSGADTMFAMNASLHQDFDGVIPINSDATSDDHADGEPTIAVAGSTIGAVWVAPSANVLDPRGVFGDPTKPFNNDLFFSRSIDGGLTWSTRKVVKTNAATDFCDDLRPWLATDGGSTWMMVWLSVDPLSGTVGFDADILCSVSTDGGATWSAPAPVNTDATSDPGGNTTIDQRCAFDHDPMVVSDGQGHWVVGWVRFDNRSGSWVTSAMTAASSNNGATWSAPVAINTIASGEMYSLGAPYIATDRQGKWTAAWQQRVALGSDYDLAYSASTNNGASWSTPANLNSNAGTDLGNDVAPSLATDGAGRWIAAWSSSDSLGGTIGTDADLIYCTSANNGATWTAAAPLNPDAATDGSGVDTLGLVYYDGAGQWMATWITNKIGGDNDIYKMTRPVTGGTWTTPMALNPWAATDSPNANDSWQRLGFDGYGQWIAAWSSPVDYLTGTDADTDIYRVLNNQLVPVEISGFKVE